MFLCLARLVPPLVLALFLAGCGNDYSPDTYATRAVQQANRAEQGVVVGVRQVQVRAEGSTGAAAGAAAGGVVGAQTPGGNIGSALGTVGGALVGGLFGKAAEHAVVDTKAYEYVVRTGKGDLLAVTQTDERPLQLGQRVLVITGTQARVVADYTTPPEPPPAPAAPAPAAAQAATPAISGAPAAEAPSEPAEPAPGPSTAERQPAIPLPPLPRPPVNLPAVPAPAAPLLENSALPSLPPGAAALVPAIAR